MLTKEKYEKYCMLQKKIISHYYKKNDLNNMLRASRYYCIFQHKLNQKFTDLELEQQLKNISYTFFGEQNLSDTSGIILYDSIGIDNIALSLQYLLYMVNSGNNFVYILLDSKKNNQLLNIAKQSPNCTLFLIEKTENYADNVIKIRNIIINAKPEKIVMHMDNCDTSGFVALCGFSNITKFFVNHGDEQFWIGSTLLDYCIEFRNLGKDVSSRLRGICPDKILLQPYYPIISKGNFQGLDLGQQNQNRIKLFSGGRFIKAYGRNMYFLKMIKEILNNNPNCCFIYAGSGNSQPMYDFIKENGFEDRWIIIPYRKDLFELICRMDIYVSTFPLMGGLMSQIAAMAGIPILELNSNVGNHSEDVLPLLNEYKITCENIDEYNERISNLINDSEERKRVGNILKKALLSREDFESNLSKILNDNSSEFDFKKIEFNEIQSAKDYFETENYYIHETPQVLRNRYMLLFYPILGVYNLFKSKYFSYIKKRQI